MKLPKQWRHWCADSRLKNEGHGRRAAHNFALVGRGHRWRVNCHGQFQRGDSNVEFDRWALCRGIYEAPVPKTRAEFRAFVAAALADAKPEEHPNRAERRSQAAHLKARAKAKKQPARVDPIDGTKWIDGAMHFPDGGCVSFIHPDWGQDFLKEAGRQP